MTFIIGVSIFLEMHSVLHNGHASYRIILHISLTYQLSSIRFSHYYNRPTLGFVIIEAGDVHQGVMLQALFLQVLSLASLWADFGLIIFGKRLFSKISIAFVVKKLFAK